MLLINPQENSRSPTRFIIQEHDMMLNKKNMSWYKYYSYPGKTSIFQTDGEFSIFLQSSRTFNRTKATSTPTYIGQ